MAAGIYGILDLIFTSNLKWVAIGFVINHLRLLFTDYLITRANSRNSSERDVENTEHESRFLGRVLILHFIVAIGGFAIQTFGSPIPLLLMLILVKTISEVFMRRD